MRETRVVYSHSVERWKGNEIVLAYSQVGSLRLFLACIAIAASSCRSVRLFPGGKSGNPVLPAIVFSA